MDNMTFEEAKKKLEEIVNKIKNENCTLDEALNLYEEGVKLSYDWFKENYKDARM